MFLHFLLDATEVEFLNYESSQDKCFNFYKYYWSWRVSSFFLQGQLFLTIPIKSLFPCMWWNQRQIWMTSDVIVLHSLSNTIALNVLRKVHTEGLATDSDYSCAMWCDHGQSFNAPRPIILSIKRTLICLTQSIWNMKLCICNVTRSISFSGNIVFCYWPITHVPPSRTGASVWLWGNKHNHVNCGQANLHFTFRNCLCYPNRCWESFQLHIDVY